VRRPGNPLALAVLALLYEKPMHPYEMSSTLKFRQKEASIKINYGSLYAVVESLEKRGLIEAVERIRDGRRPERTVYALAPSGEELMQNWLSDLLSHPSHQFTDFEAAMSLLPALPPDVVSGLLEQRLTALAAEAEEYERQRTAAPEFPRIFTVEGEYRAALRGAEQEFVRALLADIVDGTLGGLPIWLRLHELKRSGAAGKNLIEQMQTEFDPQNQWGLPQE
jgi:DNA-binding PadR family transcriptional regulator